MEKDHELREKRAESSEEPLDNKENDGSIKNDVKRGSQKVKKEKIEVVNGSVASNTVGEALANGEDKNGIQKEPYWEPINISESEVLGVKNLIERLRTWDRAIKNCPPEVPNQEALLDRLEVCSLKSYCHE